MSKSQQYEARLRTLASILDKQEAFRSNKKLLSAFYDALGIDSRPMKKPEIRDAIASKILNAIIEERVDSHTNLDLFSRRLLVRGNFEHQQYLKNICERYLAVREREQKESRYAYPSTPRTSAYTGSPSTSKQCVCYGSKKQIISPLLTCFICSTAIFHETCLKILDWSEEDKQSFECPYCSTQAMDPLNQVKQAMFEGYARLSENSACVINFNTQGIYEFLAQNPRAALELRCVRLEGKQLYEITWPDSGELRLNQQRVMQFKPLHINSSLKKRKDEKHVFDKGLITKGNCSIRLQEINPAKDIKDKHRIKEGLNYFLGLYLVVKLTAKELDRKTLATSVLPKQLSLLFLKKNFESSSEVQLEKLTISLKCNMSFGLINTPARGKHCSHFQCFSLESMSAFMEKLVPRKWKCPICRKRCHYLVVDSYLQEILQRVRAEGKRSQVVFRTDLSYELLDEQLSEESEEENTSKSPDKKQPIVLIEEEPAKGPNPIIREPLVREPIREPIREPLVREPLAREPIREPLVREPEPPSRPIVSPQLVMNSTSVPPYGLMSPIAVGMIQTGMGMMPNLQGFNIHNISGMPLTGLHNYSSPIHMHSTMNRNTSYLSEGYYHPSHAYSGSAHAPPLNYLSQPVPRYSQLAPAPSPRETRQPQPPRRQTVPTPARKNVPIPTPKSVHKQKEVIVIDSDESFTNEEDSKELQILQDRSEEDDIANPLVGFRVALKESASCKRFEEIVQQRLRSYNI